MINYVCTLHILRSRSNSYIGSLQTRLRVQTQLEEGYSCIFLFPSCFVICVTPKNKYMQDWEGKFEGGSVGPTTGKDITQELTQTLILIFILAAMVT